MILGGIKLIIYKATNIINNKIYIGQTTQSLEMRANQHLRETNSIKKQIHTFMMPQKNMVLINSFLKKQTKQKTKMILMRKNDSGFHIIILTILNTDTILIPVERLDVQNPNKQKIKQVKPQLKNGTIKKLQKKCQKDYVKEPKP